MPNIDPRIELIATELEKLGSQIERAHTDQRLLTDWFGWNHPALNRKSLADFSLRLAKQIRESSPAALGGLSDEISTKLADIPRRISTIAGQVGHFFNGNGPQAIPAYLATLQSIANDLEPILGEALRSDAIDLPKEVLRRLRAAKKTLSSFEGQLDSLSETIKIISDAQSAAEELPSTLQDLQSAKKQVETARLSAERAALNSTEGADKIDQLLKQVKANHAQSEKLVANIDEAYRIVTTKGLAAAFAQRSRTLAISMWVWVAVLMAALATGGYFASDHLSKVSENLKTTNPIWPLVWVELIIALLSVGGPVWIAWLATKQIGQRFKLAEDYGFKASIAKAYEGYRKEAARIDPDFESQLFASALDRLEEAPLRLMDQETHGSPWHEAFSSKNLKASVKPGSVEVETTCKGAQPPKTAEEA